MKRGISVQVVLLLAAGFLTAAQAQTQSRAETLNQIESLRGRLKEKETQFLAPSVEDEAAYSKFTSQPDSGIGRVVPREKFDGRLTVQGGGAYYSFNTRSNDYQSQAEIGFEQGQFHTCFAGADFGFIFDLGEVDVERISLDTPEAADLASMTVPEKLCDARHAYYSGWKGVAIGEHIYKNSLPATLGHAYLLRSVLYNESDVLVGFRVVRQDDDGSLILVWRILKRFPTPKLDPASPDCNNPDDPQK